MTGWVSCIPGCGVKLEREDDVVVMADLADEATLGAQVTVIDVLGGKSNQGVEEPFIHSVRDLWRASAGRQALRVAVLRLRPSIKCGSILRQELLFPKKYLPTWARPLRPWTRLNNAGVQLPYMDVTGGNRLKDETQIHRALPEGKECPQLSCLGPLLLLPSSSDEARGREGAKGLLFPRLCWTAC